MLIICTHMIPSYQSNIIHYTTTPASYSSTFYLHSFINSINYYTPACQSHVNLRQEKGYIVLHWIACIYYELNVTSLWSVKSYFNINLIFNVSVCPISYVATLHSTMFKYLRRKIQAYVFHACLWFAMRFTMDFMLWFN